MFLMDDKKNKSISFQVHLHVSYIRDVLMASINTETIILNR